MPRNAGACDFTQGAGHVAERKLVVVEPRHDRCRYFDPDSEFDETSDRFEHRRKRRTSECPVPTFISCFEVDVHCFEKRRQRIDRFGGQEAVGFPQDIDIQRRGFPSEVKSELGGQRWLRIRKGYGRSSTRGFGGQSCGIGRHRLDLRCLFPSSLGQPPIQAIVAGETAAGRRQGQRLRPRPIVIEGLLFDRIEVSHRDRTRRGFKLRTLSASNLTEPYLAIRQSASVGAERAVQPLAIFLEERCFGPSGVRTCMGRCRKHRSDLLEVHLEHQRPTNITQNATWNGLP
jgi:hypothetical protein